MSSHCFKLTCSGASLIARRGQSLSVRVLILWYDNISAEDRLQALEQLVTVMQSEVISARTAAAQAERRATEAETRVLGVSAGETKGLRRYDGQLETVQFHVFGLHWCS